LDHCPGPHSHAFAEIVVTELTQLPVPSFPAGYLTSPLGHQMHAVSRAFPTCPLGQFLQTPVRRAGRRNRRGCTEGR
jgi:hypothetical protein